MAVYTKISKKEISYINNKFEVDKIINFAYGVFAMIMPSLSFFITLPYFLKKINFIPSMFLSISIMVVLYFVLSMLYKKIGVDI